MLSESCFPLGTRLDKEWVKYWYWELLMVKDQKKLIVISILRHSGAKMPIRIEHNSKRGDLLFWVKKVNTRMVLF